ncbi:helix-turn-helix domain-containing protein, partial [Nocardia vulneris]
LLLALPAFVAIWSGWVGLGELTGFGPVRPLPGIADGFTINTAITLPIGMETYASYALYVWLGNRISSAGTRRYAKFSAFGSLALGAVGQVAYHLMQSAGVRSAPWAVTVLVACLPVAVLGMGAALAHMILREHHHPAVTGTAEHAVVHGGARPLPEAQEKGSTDSVHGAVAPPHAPGTEGGAPGGASESPDAPAAKTGVVRTHRRVPPARRPARHRSTIRTLRPRSTRTVTGIVPAHHPSTSAPEAAETAAEQATPADRDALIRELTARGMSARQIGPLVGVAHTTVLRVLGRTENAPADAPPAHCAPADTGSASVPVHTTPVRHPGLQVIHAPAGGPVEVIEAELVEDTERAVPHDQTTGTVRRHA